MFDEEIKKHMESINMGQLLIICGRVTTRRNKTCHKSSRKSITISNWQKKRLNMNQIFPDLNAGFFIRVHIQHITLQLHIFNVIGDDMEVKSM